MSRRADDGERGTASVDDESMRVDGAAGQRRRKQLRALVVAIGLGVAGPALAVVLVVIAGLSLGALNASLSPLVGIAITLVLTQIVGFGSVIVGYAYYRGYDLDTFGIRMPTGRELGLIVGGGTGALAVALIGATIVQALAIEGASNQVAEIGAENPEVLLLLIPAAFLVIGPCEEGLFRGIVQGRLREAFGPVLAITVAATLFAGIHVVALTGSTSARLVTIMLLLIPGLIFGAVYEYTGSLVVVAGMHGMYDALIFAMLYLVVS